MKKLDKVLVVLLCFWMHQGFVLGAQVPDKFFFPVNYVERHCDRKDCGQLLEYPDINSATKDLNGWRPEHSVVSTIDFSSWITSSKGILSSYQLPKDNTVQPVVEQTVGRWVKIRPMSNLALDDYYGWIQEHANNLVVDVAEFQRKKLLEACQQQIAFCLTELDAKSNKMQSDQQEAMLTKNAMRRTTLKLVVGTTAVTALTVRLLSHFQYFKLASVTGGLYASYLWWQYFEHKKCMRWVNKEKNNIECRLQENRRLRVELETSSVPKEQINSALDTMMYHSKLSIMAGIEKYYRQEKRKLVSWQNKQIQFYRDEQAVRQGVEDQESVAREKVVRLFIGQQSQPRPLSSTPAQQASQNLVLVAGDAQRKGWGEACRKFLGSWDQFFTSKK